MVQEINSMTGKACVILTPGLIGEFIDSLREKGRSPQTVDMYRRSLLLLYDFLPGDKAVSRDRLSGWAESLHGEGYGISTVNIRLTAVNGLLKFCEGVGVRLEKPPEKPAREEISLDEYLRLLAAAEGKKDKRDYLMIKVFASVGVGVKDISRITVKDCLAREYVSENGVPHVIPHDLARDLEDFAKGRGRLEGPVFATRSGKAVDRANITHKLSSLAGEAGVDPSKCSPRSLHRFFLATQRGIEEELRPFVTAAYDRAYDALMRAAQKPAGGGPGERAPAPVRV